MSGSFASAAAKVASAQASQANLTVNVFDGRRLPFADGPILFTIRDGNQSQVIRREFDSASVQFTGLTIFHNAEARSSGISGWGERFSNGSTSCAGSLITDLGSTAPVSSQNDCNIGNSSSAAENVIVGMKMLLTVTIFV